LCHISHSAGWGCCSPNRLTHALLAKPADHLKSPEAARHRTDRYLNNRIEQDHRGIKERYQPMRGSSAARFCRCYDELRNFLRPRSNRNKPVPANHRRLHILSYSPAAISILKAA
jgi:transposase-like protein